MGVFQVMMYMYWHVVLISCAIVRGVLVVWGGGEVEVIWYCVICD